MIFKIQLFVLLAIYIIDIFQSSSNMQDQNKDMKIKKSSDQIIQYLNHLLEKISIKNHQLAYILNKRNITHYSGKLSLIDQRIITEIKLNILRYAYIKNKIYEYIPNKKHKKINLKKFTKSQMDFLRKDIIQNIQYLNKSINTGIYSHSSWNKTDTHYLNKFIDIIQFYSNQNATNTYYMNKFIDIIQFYSNQNKTDTYLMDKFIDIIQSDPNTNAASANNLNKYINTEMQLYSNQNKTDTYFFDKFIDIIQFYSNWNATNTYYLNKFIDTIQLYSHQNITNSYYLNKFINIIQFYSNWNTTLNNLNKSINISNQFLSNKHAKIIKLTYHRNYLLSYQILKISIFFFLCSIICIFSSCYVYKLKLSESVT